MAVRLSLVVMLKRRNKQLVLFLSVLILLSVCFFGFSKANALSGITLSPFLQSINLSSNDATKTFNLNLTNNTSSTKQINLSVEDFGSLNDTGGVLLEGSNSYTQKYGLASWITLGTDTVNLGPSQTASVPVSIDNRPDLSPGGHYGACLLYTSDAADE